MNQNQIISYISDTVLPISNLIALCFFVVSEFIAVSPIMLLQTYIIIIRRSVLAAISSTLLSVQA